MFYVYILQSIRDSKLYTGFSKDLRKRIEFHSKGLVESTKNRRPLKLVYYEAYLDKNDARNRERFLKLGRGREILKVQIKQSLEIRIAK